MEPKTDKNPLTLPTSPNSSTSSSSSSTNNGSTTGSGSVPHPSTPKPNTAIPRTIETTPYPTTFVQADSASFKQVVQMLTGSTSCNTTSCKSPPINNRGPTGPKKPSFKLYERRGSLKNLKSISPLVPTGPAFFSPRAQPDVLSPSILDFPSLVLSPVTPLSPSLASPAMVVNKMEEDKAIAEKGFYLHPSPRGAEPPQLLPLFPMTSPRVSSD
ncbi:VQ motif-containing protein [Rhynchospora pubera]|uniref:VQ motif-containing protein n=1 Tax=Rhynchospora pubera TaxID=906938 RepID=A0AAV8FV74_9POAL|nr:VQ motif-containing protein [Rhynchospora pubera]KAJ4797404.1 VQ motif-containing protein [Rhynchospora pubera]